MNKMKYITYTRCHYKITKQIYTFLVIITFDMEASIIPKRPHANFPLFETALEVLFREFLHVTYGLLTSSTKQNPVPSNGDLTLGNR